MLHLIQSIPRIIISTGDQREITEEIVHVLSVQFNHSVVSDSLPPHEPQHTRPPLSITNSCSSPKPMSIESVMSSNHLILCHPLLLLLSIFRQTLYHLRHQGRPQSFPASRFFLMSQLFRSGGQSIGASAAVLPVNFQG